MITNFKGEKVTAKVCAQEILYDQAYRCIEGYWMEDVDFTDKEKREVSDQIKKIFNRIAKLLGYMPV